MWCMCCDVMYNLPVVVCSWNVDHSDRPQHVPALTDTTDNLFLFTLCPHWNEQSKLGNGVCRVTVLLGSYGDWNASAPPSPHSRGNLKVVCWWALPWSTAKPTSFQIRLRGRECEGESRRLTKWDQCSSSLIGQDTVASHSGWGCGHPGPRRFPGVTEGRESIPRVNKLVSKPRTPTSHHTLMQLHLSLMATTHHALASVSFHLRCICVGVCVRVCEAESKGKRGR